MKLVEHYIMRGTRRLVLIIVGFLIFIFASYSAQRYLTEAANGTLALDVVLDIVFYKVLIALEMLLPVGLYVSVGVTLGQMYTDSEITAISAAGGSPGRLYKAVLYLAIPLSIFVTLLSMYGRPWAYAQIYQLEQQSQSELDVRQLRAKKFNTNDNGRMILSQTVDQDNNRLTDALIYTSTANRTRIFRARSVDVVDPSPEKPTVMLHNGTAYLIDHQGRDDNEQIYRNLQLHLNPLDQSPNVKRKAKSVAATSLPYLPVIIHTQQEAMISGCNGFYFGNESPTFQMELTEQYPSKALLLIAEQNTECIIGSAFCLIIHNNDVRFAVNLDALSRSGVKVNPDVLMLARKKNDG